MLLRVIKFGFLLGLLALIEAPAGATVYQYQFTVADVKTALQLSDASYSSSAYFAIFVQPDTADVGATFFYTSITTPNPGDSVGSTWQTGALQNDNTNFVPLNSYCSQDAGGANNCWAGYYKSSGSSAPGYSTPTAGNPNGLAATGTGSATDPNITVISGANGGPASVCGSDTNIFTCYTSNGTPSASNLGHFRYESSDPAPTGFGGLSNGFDVYSNGVADGNSLQGQLITSLMSDSDTFTFTIDTPNTLSGVYNVFGIAEELNSGSTLYADSNTKNDANVPFSLLVTPTLVTQSTPEPGTAVSLVFGGALLWFRFRRRNTAGGPLHNID